MNPPQLKYSYYGDKYVKRPKYSNRSCTCWARHLHQSILESDYCNELALLKKAGEIGNYEIQHKIDITVAGKHITNHYVDFIVYKPGGVIEFHEVKGYEQELWKLKRKLVQALFPKVAYITKFEKSKWRPGLK